jgi:hypothetical protein
MNIETRINVKKDDPIFYRNVLITTVSIIVFYQFNWHSAEAGMVQILIIIVRGGGEDWVPGWANLQA